MHVATDTSKRVNKAGVEKTYRSVLLRQSFREDGKAKYRTLANLSSLPEHAIDTLRASLKGQRLVDPTQAWIITRSLPYGQVKAVDAMATDLGFQQLLGPAGRHRDIIMALLTARICKPSSKLAALSWTVDTSLTESLGAVSTDEVCAPWTGWVISNR